MKFKPHSLKFPLVDYVVAVEHFWPLPSRHFKEIC